MSLRSDWNAIYEMMCEHGWYASREDDVNLAADVRAHIDEICRLNKAELDRLRSDRDRLDEALKAMTERYCALANSGDCGFWNPEEEAEVKQARSALASIVREG